MSIYDCDDTRWPSPPVAAIETPQQDEVDYWFLVLYCFRLIKISADPEVRVNVAHILYDLVSSDTRTLPRAKRPSPDVMAAIQRDLDRRRRGATR